MAFPMIFSILYKKKTWPWTVSCTDADYLLWPKYSWW